MQISELCWGVSAHSESMGEVLEIIVKQMVREKKVRIEYAQELFDKYSR